MCAVGAGRQPLGAPLALQEKWLHVGPGTKDALQAVLL